MRIENENQSLRDIAVTPCMAYARCLQCILNVDCMLFAIIIFRFSGAEKQEITWIVDWIGLAWFISHTPNMATIFVCAHVQIKSGYMHCHRFAIWSRTFSVCSTSRVVGEQSENWFILSRHINQTCHDMFQVTGSLKSCICVCVHVSLFAYIVCLWRLINIK